MRKMLNTPYTPMLLGALAAMAGLLAVGARHPVLSAVLLALWGVNITVGVVALRRHARAPRSGWDAR